MTDKEKIANYFKGIYDATLRMPIDVSLSTTTTLLAFFDEVGVLANSYAKRINDESFSMEQSTGRSQKRLRANANHSL